MKYFYCLFLTVFLFGGCSKDEGIGGSSSLEGYVYEIVHYDDNYSFKTDTFPAAKKDVYIIYGNNWNNYFGDDVETDNNGLFRFDYLRKGDYVVYAYSEFADGHKEGIYQPVTVSKNLNKADTLFIHTGKAYGTAMIKGYVQTWYYHNGTYRDQGPGTGIRAYIRHAGEDAYFDDVRVANGIFIFQKLFPGKYEVAVETQDQNTEKISLVIQSITIREIGIIYEIPEIYEVKKSV